MTSKLNEIEKLNELVSNSSTETVVGRQEVANSCKKLYNLIEEDIYNIIGEGRLNQMFDDLCNGNFADPYMCEKKKATFQDYVSLYKAKVITS